MRRTLLALAFLAVALPGAAQPVQVLHSFDVPPSAALGGLVETPDGSLYGTTYYGGFGGTIFRLPPGGGAAAIVARFERGRYPEGPLVLGPGGLIYGATRTGGISDRGSVFRFDAATAALATIHVFDGGNDGAQPVGRLAVAADGLLYGVTERGDGGTIYQVDPATGRTRTVHRFVDFGPLGYQPIGGLIGLPNGMLYGVLRNGGPPGSTGTLYRFDPATSTFQLVHAFLQTTGGWDPTSCLTLTRDGFLYGTTLRGGSENAGTIYRLDPTTGVVQTVYELRPVAHLDGRAPFTQLVEAADGSLYGTTFESSVTTAGGTIFRLRRPPAGGHVFTTIAHLDPAVIGRGVLTDLALASDGWIYGGTESGGSGAGGTVFRFDSLERGPVGDPIQLGVVHAFQTRGTGWYPTATPFQASDGFLYGMTGSGGAAGRGDVYRMDPATGATASLGAAPLPATDPATGFTRSSFVDGGDGSLYATVATYGQGLIVRVTLATGAVSTAVSVTLPSFGSTFGVGLVRINGNLYGVMDDSAGPTLYRFDPVSATITPVCLITSGSVSFFPPGVALAGGIDGRIYATVTTVTPVFRGVTYDTRLWRVDPVAATSVMLLGAFSVADTAAAPRPDGSLAYASSSAVGAELRYIDPVSGTSRPGCVPTGYVSMRSLTAAADGSVLFVATSGIPVLRHAIFRCADGAATATRIHDFPLETRFISRLATGNGGLVYGAADVGPLGGGTIFRLAAIGATPVLDTDADGLDDAWEAAAGLRASSAAGDDGPGGDPDGDGVTNLAEQAAGTHPRGFLTRYLAEGTTNAFFHTRLALVNGGTAPARVLLRFQTQATTTVSYPILVPPTSRRTIDVETIAGLANASFSTVVESDVFVGVDRTMTWDASGYGSHTETAVSAPATTWYFAEGSTSGDFALFYLLQNPQATGVTATVRYLRPLNQAARRAAVHAAAAQPHHHPGGCRRDAREHRRLGGRGRDGADHRRARDVLQPSRPAVRRRPRERGRHGACARVVPRRGRHRSVLRSLPADRQPERLGCDGVGRLPPRRRRGGHQGLHGAGQRTVHGLGGRRAGARRLRAAAAGERGGLDGGAIDECRAGDRRAHDVVAGAGDDERLLVRSPQLAGRDLDGAAVGGGRRRDRRYRRGRDLRADRQPVRDAGSRPRAPVLRERQHHRPRLRPAGAEPHQRSDHGRVPGGDREPDPRGRGREPRREPGADRRRARDLCQPGRRDVDPRLERAWRRRCLERPRRR